MATPAFIITIDTEGDNLWQNHGHITTENARFLPRFQALCEKYRFKPVYLTNYEMAMDDAFVDFARDAIARGSAEIGMHLHAWNSPPAHDLTGNDGRHKPYLIEYPEPVMREKILFMTQLLEDTFQTKMLSHRAGRWAFDERYAAMLLELGYQVDCSVTPRVDWRRSPRAPSGAGGSNYRHFPDRAYFIAPEDISRPGASRLLEVPVTTAYKHAPWVNAVSQVYDRLRGKRRGPSVQWLRPAGGNAAQMCQVAAQSLAAGSDYVEFMLHSSEFMPGGSPTFKDEAAIERLYHDLDVLFDGLQNRVTGMTLAQYYQHRVGQTGTSA
ncbi:MAG: deacetylase [Sodalis sp. (in: enterobacteria)]|uniref:deacetylase n=1 Tax=Sodalis sp. (in: enterobacteria) TaxID=1898979 RepID=UPI0039E347F6